VAQRDLPHHHDSTAGVGAASPARSALTVRLLQAIFGVVALVAFGVYVLVDDLPTWGAIVLFVLAGIALVDSVLIVRRMAHGEAG